MAKITRRTGKLDRMGGVFGAVVLAAFSLFGFAFPLPSANDPFHDTTGDGVFLAFKVIWIVVCAAGFIYCLYMAVKGEGISKESIDVDSNGDPLIQVNVPRAESAPAVPPDFEEKLRKLQSMFDDGLITAAEYNLKREEILSEKW